MKKAKKITTSNEKKRGMLLLFVLSLCLGATGCGREQSTEQGEIVAQETETKQQKVRTIQMDEEYESIVAELGTEKAYALLDMNFEYNVMVASDMVYDDGNGNLIGLGCDIYYYVNEEAKQIGELKGEGTAYPISFSDEGIFVASSHQVEKYAISDEGKLCLEKAIYEKIDESGATKYICTDGSGETEVTEAEYREMQEEYADSKVISFYYEIADVATRK